MLLRALPLLLFVPLPALGSLDRIVNQTLLIGSFTALLVTGPLIASADDAKKDAAESVGEGNATRWLDFYRRERGEQWAAKPANEAKQQATDPVAPQDQPAHDSEPAPDRR